MWFYRMILLLNFYLWMIAFTYGLECELSGERHNAEVKLRSAIDQTRIRRQSNNAEACYMTAEIDFVTNNYSFYYSDSLTDGDKGTEHGSLLQITTVTFDQDSSVINDNEHIRGVLTYTCKDSSGCNKKMSAAILGAIKLILKDGIIPISSVKTLRRLLLKNNEETESNKPVRCFVDNSNQPIECEHNLCYVDLAEPLKRSCAGENMNGLVHITLTAVAILMGSPLDVFPKVSYTCNADQCNDIETIKLAAEALGLTSFNVVDLINKIDPGLFDIDTDDLFLENLLSEDDLDNILKNDKWSDILKDLLSKSSNESNTTTASTTSTRIVDSTPGGNNTGEEFTTTASTNLTRIVDSTPGGSNTNEDHYPIFILLCVGLIIVFGF